MPNHQTIMINGNVESIWDGRVTKCTKCGATIGFGIVKKSGKPSPFDMVQIERRIKGKVVLVHESHFASCPFGNSFKKS